MAQVFPLLTDRIAIICVASWEWLLEVCVLQRLKRGEAFLLTFRCRLPSDTKCRDASVRFGSVTVRGVERFERFRFSVPAVPLQKRFFFVSVQFNRKGRFRFRFRFGSWKRFRRFRFRFRFREKRFRRFRFPVLGRFLNHTGWVAFRLEDVRETEGEEQTWGIKQQRWERREKIETWKPPRFRCFFHGHFWL